MQDAKRDNAIKKAIRRRGAHLLEAVRPPGATSKRKAALPERSATRLVASPVFVLSSVRSGSALLHTLLDRHSLIRAPHDLHLRTFMVEPSRTYSEDIMDAIGLTRTELDHLLWDRILHYELIRSDKTIIVETTPCNSSQWQQFAEAWPDARYIFLQRHPAAIVESVMSHREGAEHGAVVKEVLDQLTDVEAARQSLQGLTVRYEDLASDPAAVSRRLCQYLGVEWEATMAGPGLVQSARPLPRPDDVPQDLREITALWGY